MKYNNNFEYDLLLGQKGENYLGKILENKKLEVKTDLQAMKTRNVFVEYKSRGKKSGIATSKSKWYAFIISNENIALIETKKLKRKCAIYVNTSRDIKGGDNNTSKGILLPLSELLE